MTPVVRFQVMHGHLFGLSSAVMNFNRCSNCFEGAGRRILQVMVALYYDGACIVELSALDASKHAQYAVSATVAAIGFASAYDKRRLVSHNTDFLGIEHALTACSSTGLMHLAPRDRLVKGTRSILFNALEDNYLSPGEASTLCGKVQFMATAIYNNVGRVGLRSIIQRIYVRTLSFTLFATLRSPINVFVTISNRIPKRPVHMFPFSTLFIAIASDAQYTKGKPASAGAVAIDGEAGMSLALFGCIPQQFLDMWGFPLEELAKKANPIAPCESAIVLTTLH